MELNISGRERFYTRLVVALSVIIPALVALLLFAAPDALRSNVDLSILPAFHALINGTTAILLVLALVMIRKKKIRSHRAIMLACLLLSAVFLISYVVYHTLSHHTTHEGTGAVLYVYYGVLISHIILAVIVVPLVGFTLLRALSANYSAHRRLARWTFPIWLYVAISGVVVYFMISPYYA